MFIFSDKKSNPCQIRLINIIYSSLLQVINPIYGQIINNYGSKVILIKLIIYVIQDVHELQSCKFNVSAQCKK